MNKKQLPHFRKQLEDLREELCSKLEQHSARSLEAAHESFDVEEDVREFSEIATEDALTLSETNLLENIDLALKRIDDGSYGCCLLCAEEIPSKRLEAQPSVALCVKCQTGKESETGA